MKKRVKEYTLITIGVVLIAIGLEYFLFPNNIAAGGVSGLALVLYNVLNLEPGVTMTISNIILFTIAFIFIGGNFGVKSVYAAFALSTLLSLIEKFLAPNAITNNLLLATIFGSVILAMGSSLVFIQGASTGGTSITATLLNKYCNLDIGKGLFISDSIVILLAIYTFGIELGLFGLVSVYMVSTMIDRFIDGFNSCKQVFIITDKEELVVNYIMKDVSRGCTVLKGKGAFTGVENSIIYTVLNRRQFIQLKQFMKENNPTAFITVNRVMEVLGEGFGSLIGE